jgi:tetratricopeptide (TPR) repeat protein
LSDIHISREILRAVARGEMSPQALAEIRLNHLFSLCPTCEEEFQAFQNEITAPLRYDLALRVVPALLERHGPEEERKQLEAERDFQALLEIPSEKRIVKIHRSNQRFRGTLLARRLLDESKGQMTIDPDHAEELAQTAEVVLLRTPDSPGINDLRALAAAYRANVARLRGNPEEARSGFTRARSIIRSAGVADPLVFAEVDSCEAVLARELRHFESAEELLDRSIRLYLLVRARERAAHPLLTLGLLYSDRGEPQRAIDATRTALRFMNPREDHRLFTFAHLNLATYLCDAGYYAESADALEENRALFRNLPERYFQVHIPWLQAKIARGTGDLEEAERLFLAVREEFLIHRQGYDAAMVSLDLALVYLEQGRTGELLRLAEEMHALFTAEEVHREALAALLVFEEAARKEQITAEAIRRLAALLKSQRR